MEASVRTIRSVPDAGAHIYDPFIGGPTVHAACFDAPADVIAQMLSCPPRPRRRNNHLSVSRLKRLEECPAAYAYHYIFKVDSDEEAVPADFGVLLHEVLETIMQWVVDTEFTGQISEQQVLDLYRAAWPRYESLIGIELYQEGARILREHIRKHGRVDHLRILSVELEFNLRLEEFVVNGYMDRVDKVNDDTIRIVDYKSSWLIFSRDEIDADLQMSVYGLAAQQMWPWAKHIEYEFHMIRHGVELKTSRTQQQLDDARDYVLTMGRQSETAEEFPARLNSNCSTCAFRKICPEYARAIEGKIEKIAYTQDDLDAVARAQQQAAKLAKLYYARKRETEDILRPHIDKHEEIVAGGAKFRMIKYAREKEYPIDKTIGLLTKLGGLTEREARDRFIKVDTGAVDRWVEKELPERKSKATAKLVEMQLDLAADKIYSHKFDAQPLKGPAAKALRQPVAKDGSLLGPGETT